MNGVNFAIEPCANFTHGLVKKTSHRTDRNGSAVSEPLSYGLLKLHPHWDSLRGHPRLRKSLGLARPEIGAPGCSGSAESGRWHRAATAQSAVAPVTVLGNAAQTSGRNGKRSASPDDLNDGHKRQKRKRKSHYEKQKKIS